MNMTPLNGSNKIVVVGGGAAGMMAAGMAAQAGAHVTLLEQNGRPGKRGGRFWRMWESERANYPSHRAG